MQKKKKSLKSYVCQVVWYNSRRVQSSSLKLRTIEHSERTEEDVVSSENWSSQGLFRKQYKAHRISLEEGIVLLENYMMVEKDTQYHNNLREEGKKYYPAHEIGFVGRLFRIDLSAAGACKLPTIKSLGSCHLYPSRNSS